MMIKNSINWFDRNICIWDNERSINEKEEITCNNIIKDYKNDYFVDFKNLKEHKPNWPQIPDHPYRILIIGGSGSGKANSFNVVSQ